jgi:proteasome lid subunit RPN8/RPN11
MLEPLVVSAELRRAMIEHCRSEAPLECCGVLGGARRIASSIFRFRNVAASETRFEADPQDVIRAVQGLRARGEEFVAIYHSHPRWRAIPSKTDLERNGYGDLPQIIVGLLDDPPEVRAWRLDPSSFVEIPLIVGEPGVEPPGGDG